MPVYCYRVRAESKGCNHCRAGFEIRQRIEDRKLACCPQCKAPIQRIITSCNYLRGYSRKPLSSQAIKRSGLRKLVKDDDGRYVDGT